MKQRNLYKRLLQIKKMTSFPIIKSLFPAILFLVGISFTSTAQTAPAFVAGRHQTLTMCENSPAIDVSTMMDITDPDVGDVEQWDTVAGARNGTLNGFPNANLATGGVTSITGITYQPAAGFSGLDSFAILVTDGTDTDTTTVVIIVNPVPVVAPLVGSSFACIATTSIITEDSTGGVWSSSVTGSASVVGGTVTG